MTESLLNHVGAFIESGDPDISSFGAPDRETIIRERFKDEPWIIAFALEMQGVHYVTDLDDVEREATDSFQGEYNDLADFAGSLLEDAYSEFLNDLPEFIRYNIDYAAIGRDMELGGEVNTFDTGNYSVYVFNTQW
jgi:hypothetical protein